MAEGIRMADLITRSLWHGLVASICVGLIYPLVCAIYNLYFHPLRSYPGPLLMRATRWGFCYRLLRGTLPFDILELHKKYGDVVRVAPDELAFSNVDAWRDIMGHRSQGALEFKKDDRFYRARADSPHTVVDSNGKIHSTLRRQLSHGFSDKILREQEPFITKYLDLFIQRLHENCDGGKHPVDMMAWFNFTTFDVIGDLAFGEPFGCLESSEYHPWVQAITHSARMGVVVQTASHFPWLKKIIFGLLASKKGLAARGENMARARDKLVRRIETGKRQGGRPDLIEGLLKKREELGLSFDELTANSNTLIIGGSETTATLLAGVTYYLLKNRECLQKLTAEVRSHHPKEEDIDLLSVGKLSYMLACLDEAMRIYSPISMGLPRVVPEGGATICGKFVPENTTVAIHQYAIHHNDKYFKEPMEFHPERFLGDANYATDNRDAFQPFHIGPRNCLGRSLAYVEMRLILARLVWNFDMELAAEDNEWAEKQKIYILWEKGPLRVRLTPVTS